MKSSVSARSLGQAQPIKEDDCSDARVAPQAPALADLYRTILGLRTDVVSAGAATVATCSAVGPPVCMSDLARVVYVATAARLSATARSEMAVFVFMEFRVFRLSQVQSEDGAKLLAGAVGQAQDFFHCSRQFVASKRL